MLTDWAENDGDHSLLALRALGGFGKRALAWHWLLHDVDPAQWPRVVWWSFYEGDNTFESFLRETLAYLLRSANQRSAANVGDSPRHQVDALLRLLHHPGALLILDGFERALRAYNSMNAPYQGDDPDDHKPDKTTNPRSPVPNPQSSRDCVSPVAEHFLRSLASLPGLRGKVLMTTSLRLLPRVLEVHGGELLMGC